jgi:hypothetical protein
VACDNQPVGVTGSLRSRDVLYSVPAYGVRLPVRKVLIFLVLSGAVSTHAQDGKKYDGKEIRVKGFLFGAKSHAYQNGQYSFYLVLFLSDASSKLAISTDGLQLVGGENADTDFLPKDVPFLEMTSVRGVFYAEIGHTEYRGKIKLLVWRFLEPASYDQHLTNSDANRIRKLKRLQQITCFGWMYGTRN